jgi:hypothetical protein
MTLLAKRWSIMPISIRHVNQLVLHTPMRQHHYTTPESILHTIQLATTVPLDIPWVRVLQLTVREAR